MRGRNRKSHNPLTRVYESNGPDVKIRGTPSHIAEKYVQLSRDAQSSGDPVSAENYLQHAEHYFRLIASAQEQVRPNQPFMRPEGGGMDMRDDAIDEEGDEEMAPGPGEQPSFGTREPQPYLPRDAQFFSPREQPNFAPRHNQGQSDEDSHERLPSFITGGGAGQPQQAAPQAGHQGHGQNGYDNQADRFPLHRRRRRHRGPRNDMGQGPQAAGGGGDGDDIPQGPRSNGD